MNIAITGASKGVGYAVALYFAKEKHHKIFAISRSVEGLEKLRKEGGEGIISLRCDITRDQEIAEAVEEIGDRVNGIDILINNAGLLINKPFSQLSMADWRAIYEVNVFGVFGMTKALLPKLGEGDLSHGGAIRSHIVNIASAGGVQGSAKYKGLSAYSSSKGALIAMSECLAEEVSSMGIVSNSIALGSVETEMFRLAFPGLKASVSTERIARWIGQFAESGYEFFNGKTLVASTNNP